MTISPIRLGFLCFAHFRMQKVRAVIGLSLQARPGSWLAAHWMASFNNHWKL